ncbi:MULTISPECIES: DNA polymerase IV [unclassified Paenibacillus]|uniref:DNA polymerase IV n=1 Tax=unclassified Paenibacillus TaxID=185978 RepID=UPI00277D229C|nr:MULTISPECIES: DNA polymerase IV [unclassified Paenibacillus]MDQ0896283.1 nucleotidyltransferase/DNA polymerase involved in DNA repair [Paenibacillus sp. V4I7]MDQ0913789.1 nucleotidyltransferase/DNA polymerase involved in DNA repair [Paenibacillus sp. V4I5]
MKDQKVIMLADGMSFYASVEKADHPNIRYRPVAVAGSVERRSGIILAACPIAKSFGVTTADRLGEALGKCPELIVMKPRMQHYIDVSMQITRIYQEFTDLVEIFSIDESWLDVTGSINQFGDADTIARMIQNQVMQQTGVRVRVGIGSNKMMSKMANSIWAKKNESGIFTLEKDQIPTLLWPQPVEKMFGVAGRMTSHFERLGMHTIGDIARTPLPKLKDKFRVLFGKQSDIHAEIMWRTANSIDNSPVTPNTFDIAPKSIGHMMTLPRDFLNSREVDTILLELTEEICRDARRKGFMGSVVSVSCMCSPFDAPTGFSRQQKMPDPTNSTNAVYSAAKTLFYRYWNTLPVRRVGVTLSQLADDETYQLNMFEDVPKIRALEKVTDTIKDRFGSTAIMRASSLLDSGQALDRGSKIGGHFK